MLTVLAVFNRLIDHEKPWVAQIASVGGGNPGVDFGDIWTEPHEMGGGRALACIHDATCGSCTVADR